MNSLRAIAIIMVYGVLLVVGTPGLDFMRSASYASPSRIEKAHREHGEFMGNVVMQIHRFNQTVRKPFAKKIGKFQPLFRIRQSWHLYRDGPRTIRRLEVWIDGKRVYRTLDPEDDWHAAHFRNRRIRPVVESTVKKVKSANWRGLTRWIVAEARADFPEANTVEMRALSGRRNKRLKTHHRFTASAPDWKVERSQ